MKIAILLTHFPTVSETFILHHITGLIDRGHQVDICSYRRPRVRAPHEEVEQYRLMDRTLYWGFDGRGGGRRFTKVLAEGIPTLTSLSRPPVGLSRVMRVVRSYGRAASPLVLYGASSFLRNGKREYDIIHCHYGRNGTLAVVLRELGVLRGKVVTSFHGNDISGYVHASGRDVYATLFALGDLFLPVSERWKAELIELGCRPERIVVHRLGIDRKRFRYGPRTLRETGEIRLLTVARLVEKKGLEYALRAVARLTSRWPRIRYQIVGEGPLRADLQSLIGELGLAGHVEILGPQKQETVARLMREADLFLLASVTSRERDQEGIPVAMMEAMATGLPVLTTRHSGIPELVEDGVSGYLVPERDVDALTERLAGLLGGPEKWEAMGKAGSDFVRAHHDIDATNDRLVRLYEALMERPAAIPA